MQAAQFQSIYNNHLAPFQIGYTAQNTLQEFIDVDVTTTDLMRIMNENPAYLHMLDRFISKKAKSKEDELTPVYRLISLLGLVGTRNFILALRISKAATGQFPFNDKGELACTPKEVLKRAINIEDICQLREYPNSETAFAAGYLYDWMLAMAKKKGIPKNVEAYIELTWKQSLKTAIFSHYLAHAIKGFGSTKYAFASAMLVGLGKCTMALELQNQWIDHQNKLQKRPIPNFTASIIDEEKTFGFSHATMAGLVVRYSKIFSQFEKVFHFYPYPYFLKDEDHNLHQFSALIHLAHNIVFSNKIPVDAKDPLLAEWYKPWSAKVLKFTPDTLLSTVQEANKVSI